MWFLLCVSKYMWRLAYQRQTLVNIWKTDDLLRIVYLWCTMLAQSFGSFCFWGENMWVHEVKVQRGGNVKCIRQYRDIVGIFPRLHRDVTGESQAAGKSVRSWGWRCGRRRWWWCYGDFMINTILPLTWYSFQDLDRKTGSQSGRHIDKQRQVSGWKINTKYK